jgi:methionyl aminopeptidase
MDETIYQAYKQAGHIAKEARDYGASLLKPNTTYLQIATAIEARIQERGGRPAFPVNIACNSLAAHYTPTYNDTMTIKPGDVVKLDVGVHINGYIADTAVTVEVATHKHDALIKASSDALDAAIAHMKPNIPPSDIGRLVEETITSQGFKPIENLMGHSITQYELHSGLSIPNIATYVSRGRPHEGDVIAIEPFATTGSGRVVSGEGSNIYLCADSLKTRFIRDRALRLLYDRIHTRFTTLSFASRWCHPFLPQGSSDLPLRRLARLGVIKEYPQFREERDGMVAQREHTVIITKDGCEVIT